MYLVKGQNESRNNRIKRPMQTVKVVQKLDYGYLVKTEDDEQIFLDTQNEYSLNSSVKIIKEGDKCVDHCVVESGLQEGFVVAEYAHEMFTVDKKEIVVLAPISIKRYSGIHVSKMGDFYVGRLLLHQNELVHSSKLSEVLQSLSSININSLKYYKPADIDLSIATPIVKFKKFCKQFELLVLSSNDNLFFSKPSSKLLFHHDMPYGVLIDDVQFHSYRDIYRGIPCSFKVIEQHIQSKKLVGHWCKINDYESFLPIHHSTPNIKIGSVHNGIVWDIQQETIVVSLKPFNQGPFHSLLDVKQYLLQSDTCDVIVRLKDANRIQVDFFGIRSWLDGSSSVGSIITCSCSGTINSIHFRNSWSIVKVIPLQNGVQFNNKIYESNIFTRDVVHSQSTTALYGPCLIVKPLILENKHVYEVGHVFPFWIHNIDKNSLYLSSWHDGKLVKGIAFKRNIADYFITDLCIFTVGQTVIALIESFNEHGCVVSLKWNRIKQAIDSNGFNCGNLLNINNVPDYVATIINSIPRQYVGTRVSCSLIKSVANGLHVAFTLNNNVTNGFIATSIIPKSSTFNCIIIHHASLLFDLILDDSEAHKSALATGTKRKMDTFATVLLVKPDYAIAMDNGRNIGYIPCRSFNIALQHGLMVGNTVSVYSYNINDILLFKQTTDSMKKTNALPFTISNPIDSNLTVDNITSISFKVLITNVKLLQLNIKIADNLVGRVCSHYATSTPISALSSLFRKNDTISVKLLAYKHSSTGRFLPLSHSLSMRNCLLECCLSTFDNNMFDLITKNKPLTVGEWYLCAVITLSTSKPSVMVQITPSQCGILNSVSYDGNIKELKIGQVLLLKLTFIKNEHYFVCNVDKRCIITADLPLEYHCLQSTGQTSIIHKLDGQHSLNDIVAISSTNMHKGRCYINAGTSPVSSGDIVNGIISGIQSNGVYVTVRYNKVARVKISNISDEYVKDWKSLVTLHSMVQCLILDVNENGMIEASLKYSLIQNINYYELLQLNSIVDAKVDHMNKHGIYFHLLMNQPRNVVVKGFMGIKSEDTIDLVVNSIVKVKILEVTKSKSNSYKVLVNMDTPLNEEIIVQDSHDAIKNDEGSIASSVSWQSDDDSDDATKDETIVVQAPFVENRELELLVMEHPNKSMYWIQYMAYAMDINIKHARMIAQRGLKTIHYREEVERRNMYIALLNMEMEMGTVNSMVQCLESTLQVNDHKLIYMHCMKRLVNTELNERNASLMDMLITRVLKEYKRSCKIWLLMIEYYFKQDVKKAHEQIEKGLKCVPKHKHLKLIQKYSVLEYIYGDKERSRTILHGLMSEHSKRLDIWSMWVDMEIKHEEIEKARQLFLWILDKKSYKARQVKHIYEKYIKFEKDHGDEDKLDQVQLKAMEYVKEMNMK
eukprot:NODE_85_length_22318_cov_0.288492.p1 type:complete len:1397 gc:universal NODE_85_length_22318_cov_0.288492:17639-13449(-)